MSLRKKQWHKENRPYVFKYFDFTCQKCGHIIKNRGDIHHLTYHYHKPIYETPASELLEAGVITLLCRQCHNSEHTAENPENPGHLENMVACFYCGSLTKISNERRDNLGIKSFACRKCYSLKKREIKRFGKVDDQPNNQQRLL